MSIDLERARFNMVEQQIRPWEVLDTKVLDLLHVVKREEFVPPAYKDLAFADLEIPIGLGEKMLAPKLEARMLQELAITPGDRILEVGTGSGYMTALMASQGAHVYSIDIVDAFLQIAGERLAQHGIKNVTLEKADGARGYEKHGPYDAIVLTGSVPVLVDGFAQSLNSGGRLFAVVGDEPVMEARLITCAGPGAFNTASLFETCIPPLRNAPQRQRFSF